MLRFHEADNVLHPIQSNTILNPDLLLVCLVLQVVVITLPHCFCQFPNLHPVCRETYSWERGRCTCLSAVAWDSKEMAAHQKRYPLAKPRPSLYMSVLKPCFDDREIYPIEISVIRRFRSWIISLMDKCCKIAATDLSDDWLDHG